jgi:hypothetical protein
MKTDTLAFITHLPRERVIALLGSTARLDYTPPPREDPSEKAYWLEGEQARVTKELDRDGSRIIALHLLAIIWWRLRHGKRLTRAMVTGDAEGLPPATEAARDDAGMRIRALVVLAICAGVVGYMVR